MFFASARPGQELESRRRRPNVLILLTDDQRFSTINALGYGEVRTPHLDSLVRRSTAFTHACIMGGSQPAVCVPSRAMLLTGRTLFHLTGTGKTVPFSDVTLSELLRRHGYRTFHTGKWHQDRASFARSFTRGANIFFGGMTDHTSVPVYDFDRSGAYPPGKQRTAEKFSSELFADSAIEFLEEQTGDQPFLAYVAFTSPHDPRQAPRRFRDLYDPSRLTLPPNFLPEHPFDNGELKVRDELLAAFPRTPEIVREHLADYYAMVSEVDEQVGRILSTLEWKGLRENTLIVFAGDNGLAVGQHGLLGKQNVYEHSVRVPLLLAGPGIPEGRRSDAFCYLLDVYPTLCQLLGIRTPTTVEGVSLGPALEGSAGAGRETLFFAYRDFQRAVRTRTHKLIEYAVAGERRTQLFDLVADPHETRDLAGDSRNQALIADLRAKLSAWQKQLDDQLVL
jgi:arylsulfatase A-like enzyme